MTAQASGAGTTRQTRTIPETAEILGVHRNTVSKLLKAGKLTAIAGVSNRKKITVTSINELLEGAQQ